MYFPIVVDEGRKRLLLIAASILAARKLASFEGEKTIPATLSVIAESGAVDRTDFNNTRMPCPGWLCGLPKRRGE